MTIDDVSIGRDFFDAVFHFFFFLLCDMGFYYSLFYFTTRRGWESDSERRIRQRRHTTKQITHLIRKGLYEKLDGTLSWIDAVSMIIPMLERGGGDGKEEAKSRLWTEQGPALPFLYEFFFSALSYFLIKRSSGFI
ncbi:uncharacterized protein TrAFT101_004092 [Trichoderma asperellum]|uniref:uncharacterized protein n=1 Tax=Trichoderma asperellum TaxID=101201 RepID=UPI00332E0219|nr:hypothetical protein TrAFT101_004092 [Trichoderma asperellum]